MVTITAFRGFAKTSYHTNFALDKQIVKPTAHEENEKTAYLILFSVLTANSQVMENPNTDMSVAPVEQLTLTQEWDKVFPKSDKVDHRKVTFVNRYGITLAADMYTPKDAAGKLPAIAVSGPFGAVKEQSSGLYAQQLAERGFITIAFDPSFTGESGGSRGVWLRLT